MPDSYALFDAVKPLSSGKALGLSGTQLTDAAAEAFSRALVEGKVGGGSGGGEGAGWGPKTTQEKMKVETGAGGRDSFVGEEEEEEEEGGEEMEATHAAGARAIAACSLRRLDLSRNSITDIGARCASILRRWAVSGGTRHRLRNRWDLLVVSGHIVRPLERFSSHFSC